MEKIVIVGSSGAGKSTFAKLLGPMLHIKIFHLDRFFWERNWKRKTSYNRMELLEKLALGEKQWIIEGSYLYSLEPGLREADTIIFLDISPFLCLGRIIKRHSEYGKLSRRDIPEGCTDKLTVPFMAQVLFFPLYGRRKIERTLLKYPSKQIILLQSVKEVERFLISQEQITGLKKDFSNSVFIEKEKIFANSHIHSLAFS